MNPNAAAMQGGGADGMPAGMHPMHYPPQPQQGGPGGPRGPHGMQQPMVRVCGGCGHKIMDRFLLQALDLFWHNGCLKCQICQATLADIGTTCFTKGGMILCKKDYFKRYGANGVCSACQQMIPAGDIVMRAQSNVYHLNCFACAKCHNPLVPGDRYNIVSGSLLCEQNCLKMLKGSVSPVQRGKNSKVRLNSAIKV